VDGDDGPEARYLVVSIYDLLVASASYLIEYDQDRSSIPEVRLSLILDVTHAVPAVPGLTSPLAPARMGV
jgi:hypothetical protein